MNHHYPAGYGHGDDLLAAGLITAPAWVDWLSEINQLLTTVSLIIGVALGLARLWVTLSSRLRRKD